ncbi:MAG: CvpA family protein [Clostridia bacterium]|nr:CvpA family protein [Clostridia bacterium]MBQ7038609.1 CvpA family protein [Clostridia bacterium]
MPYILDAIVVVIVAVAAIVGYRRGFIRTIIQLAGCIIAFILALSLSATVSTVVYDGLLRDGLHEKIETTWSETVVEGAAQTLTEQTQAVFDTLPTFVQTALDTETITQGIQDSVGNDHTGTAVADYLVDDLIRPVMVAVIRFVAFLLLFAILMIVIRLLEKLLKPITKLPLVRQTDGLLGTVVGLAKGAVFALVAVTIMQLIAAGTTTGPFTQKNLDNSVVAGWIAQINPLSAVLNLD